MSRLFFFGGAMADLAASLLHAASSDNDWTRVALVGFGGLALSATWRVMGFMLEMSEHKPLEIPVRVR